MKYQLEAAILPERTPKIDTEEPKGSLIKPRNIFFIPHKTLNMVIVQVKL